MSCALQYYYIDELPKGSVTIARYWFESRGFLPDTPVSFHRKVGRVGVRHSPAVEASLSLKVAKEKQCSNNERFDIRSLLMKTKCSNAGSLTCSHYMVVTFFIDCVSALLYWRKFPPTEKITNWSEGRLERACNDWDWKTKAAHTCQQKFIARYTLYWGEHMMFQR